MNIEILFRSRVAHERFPVLEFCREKIQDVEITAAPAEMQSENNSHDQIVKGADEIKQDQNRDKQQGKDGKGGNDSDQCRFAVSKYMRNAAERTAPAHAEGELFTCQCFVRNAVYQLVQNDVCARNCNKSNVGDEQLKRIHFKESRDRSVGNVQGYDGKDDDGYQNHQRNQIEDDAEFGGFCVDIESLSIACR